MSNATAIPATRRQYKEMADGTLRVSLDIDPPYKQEFLKLFPDIDSPCALAPLVNDFEQMQGDPTTVSLTSFEQTKELARELNGTELKGGKLARLAGILCNDPAFQKWLGKKEYGWTLTGEDAAQYIRSICHIESRRDLDHNPEAARIFDEKIRKPYLEHQGLV